MKIKLYFFHEQWQWEKEGAITAFAVKLEDELVGSRLRVFIAEQEVDVPDMALLSESEVKQLMVTGLRQEAKNLQAETHIKITKLEEKIQQLLALTYSPESDLRQHVEELDEA